MNVFEAMSSCRAIRYLRPDPIPEELIEQVVTAATWAPSPGNSQGRDFIVVTDQTKREIIGNAIEKVMGSRVASMDRPDKTHRLMLDGTEHLLATLKTCPVLVFVCGKAIYPYEAPRESFVWSSIYPAAQNLIVAARAIGLGTVFTTFQGVAENVIRETLDIPDDVLIGCMIPMGWPDRKFGPLNREPYEKVVHRDKWQGELRNNHLRS
ncbi:MAG TPA: nitroreductase family protein [Acidimicrobiales bacterium]|nr:nitroreductase family protein [Acidimicrobiales bacterium]